VGRRAGPAMRRRVAAAMGRRLERVLAPLLAAAALACGGGGGGGGNGPPTQPQPSVTFSPAGTAGLNSIALQSDPLTTPQALVVQVIARGVADLYAVAFDLQYPTAQLRFRQAEEGDYLRTGGASTSLQVVEGPAGTLVIGLTRLGAVAGVSGGEGLLVRVTFDAVGAGSGELRFAENAAFDSTGAIKTDVRWVAGSVTVVR
jgi:hypothetical protein